MAKTTKSKPVAVAAGDRAKAVESALDQIRDKFGDLVRLKVGTYDNS